jgi:hypothetical protein
MRSLLCLTIIAAGFTCAQEKYIGPKPPKPDILYLVHADNLIPTEVTEAKGESKHNETVYTIPGAGSQARTPLAEPIFIIQADRISPQALELYKADVKGGKREVAMVQKHTRSSPRPLRLTVSRLGGDLYRVEVDETIENGEYAISPNGSNTVFCFAVY